MLVAAVHLHDISWDCSTFSRIFNYEENDEHQCSVSYVVKMLYRFVRNI